MNWQPTLDDVLQDLCARSVLCGVSTIPGGEIRAWIEVRGTLIEEYFELSPRVSDQIALWLRETTDRARAAISVRVYGTLPDLVPGVLADNVVDARSRFLGRRVARIERWPTTGR